MSVPCVEFAGAETKAEQCERPIAKRLAKVLGKSKERYRLHSDLTEAQQTVIAESLGVDDEYMARFDLESLGLPPFTSLRRWAGLAPASPLELRAGKWPVWKWLKAASRGEIKDAAAITAIGKALDAQQIAELCRIVRDEAFDYDLFDNQLRDRKGEIEANALHARMARLFAALLDGSGG
ncbi:MAG: hypothetical protein H0T89_35805 [Deltaproteobacteria bacterium]|nr:hypothetical protein [Deltaproteobacteria bacterium]MDQ3301059.1 hypothetical protein [Myxococcota bacterium]